MFEFNLSADFKATQRIIYFPWLSVILNNYYVLEFLHIT